jgi:hypothetical protein
MPRIQLQYVWLKHAMVDIKVANGCPQPQTKTDMAELVWSTKIFCKKVQFDLPLVPDNH